MFWTRHSGEKLAANMHKIIASVSIVSRCVYRMVPNKPVHHSSVLIAQFNIQTPMRCCAIALVCIYLVITAFRINNKMKRAKLSKKFGCFWVINSDETIPCVDNCSNSIDKFPAHTNTHTNTAVASFKFHAIYRFSQFWQLNERPDSLRFDWRRALTKYGLARKFIYIN